jgi:glycine amidinotransferase
MYSKNEWGNLKKVIVGVADYAVVPPLDKSLRTINYAGISDDEVIKSGPYPKQVIDEANEDLEILVRFLKSQNIEVVRPNKEETKYYNFCPRDCVFLHGKLALATPMPLRSRLGNWRSYKHHLQNVTEIPCCYFDDLYNTDCIGNPDILALTNITPAFDAANIIRANDEILYLVSNTGNVLGAKLLQDLLGEIYGNSVQVHLLKDIYSYAHIDTTIAFLREGLLLANPSRIKSKDDLPGPFKYWDVIWCPEPVDIGHYPGYNSASAWSNMNLLSINSNLVVLEKHQDPTRRELEKYGIECAMLPMRQGRTLSGFFHCVTLDLEREEV